MEASRSGLGLRVHMYMQPYTSFNASTNLSSVKQLEYIVQPWGGNYTIYQGPIILGSDQLI